MKSRIFCVAVISTLIACGAQTPNQSLITETSEAGGADESGIIVDNSSAFGVEGLLPENLSESQVQNLAILMKAFTSAGLLETSRRLGDNHIISKLRLQMHAAEENVKKARALVSTDDRLRALDIERRALRTLQEEANKVAGEIKTLTASAATEKNAAQIAANQARLSELNLRSRQLPGLISSAEAKVRNIVNGSVVMPTAEVNALRDAAKTKLSGIREKLSKEVSRVPGSGLRGAFRKLAFFGGVLVAVDASAHIYVMHGLDLKPSIYPTAQAAMILGPEAYNWALSKADQYLGSDNTDYQSELN